MSISKTHMSIHELAHMKMLLLFCTALILFDMTDATLRTFHRRQLPSPAVPFSSLEGRGLFQKALEQGNLNGYFRLSETYSTQGHPAFCALGSLTMALNALLIDPQRVWQGVWRWFDESMLDCCQPLETTKLKGMTLSKLACLARCNSAAVTVKYGNEVSLEEFRADVESITSVPTTSPYRVLIASYNRRTLAQSGSGHFSPIGGYERESDSVLILDVARFKYPPHWVPLSQLYAAFQDVDPETGKPRGYMLLEATDRMYERCECVESPCAVKNSEETSRSTATASETISTSRTDTDATTKSDAEVDKELGEKSLVEVIGGQTRDSNHVCEDCCRH